jgi:hypothetical protein
MVLFEALIRAHYARLLLSNHFEAVVSFLGNPFMWDKKLLTGAEGGF